MINFLRKRLFSKLQKVAATRYYGIENPLPDIISKLRLFLGGGGGGGGGGGVLVVGCQEPLVV